MDLCLKYIKRGTGKEISLIFMIFNQFFSLVDLQNIAQYSSDGLYCQVFWRIRFCQLIILVVKFSRLLQLEQPKVSYFSAFIHYIVFSYIASGLCQVGLVNGISYRQKFKVIYTLRLVRFLSAFRSLLHMKKLSYPILQTIQQVANINQVFE